MTDKIGEIDQSVSYQSRSLPRELANAQPPIWRIVHPEKITTGRSYVGLVVATGPKPELALVSKDKNPPEEALQFCRLRDAFAFADAFLARDIIWQFEGQRHHAPPIWAEAEPLERTPAEYRDHALREEPVRSIEIDIRCRDDVCCRPSFCRAEGCQNRPAAHPGWFKPGPGFGGAP